jgi:hypothetical protein
MFDREEQVAAAVGAMLRWALAPDVRIVASEPLTQERSVWRCRLQDGPGQPESVIVRTKRDMGGWRTEPTYLRTDYAATAFLWDRCPGVTARIIAADAEAGLFVTEDLGSGPSLGDLLAGTSRAQAARGLVAFATTLGQMHAATAGLENEYYRQRRLLGPADPREYRTLLGELSVQKAARRVLDARVSGRTAPRQASSETQTILAALAEPGSFLALSNGDPCPYNCLVTRGIARLIDFELAGYRHTLLDAAYLHLGFQWCYQPGQLPPDVLDDAETAYRLQAGAGIPLMLDEPAYQQALTGAATAWVILSAGALLRQLDRSGSLPAADQGRHVATMREYIAVFGSASCYPAMSHWITDLVGAFELGKPGSRPSRYRPFER